METTNQEMIPTEKIPMKKDRMKRGRKNDQGAHSDQTGSVEGE
jgi:hypothetical protein